MIYGCDPVNDKCLDQNDHHFYVFYESIFSYACNNLLIYIFNKVGSFSYFVLVIYHKRNLKPLFTFLDIEKKWDTRWMQHQVLLTRINRAQYELLAEMIKYNIFIAQTETYEIIQQTHPPHQVNSDCEHNKIKIGFTDT